MTLIDAAPREPAALDVTGSFTDRIPEGFARTHLVLGVVSDRGGIELLVSDSTPHWIPSNVSAAFGEVG